MSTVDLLMLCIPGAFFGLMALEAAFPAQPLPERRGWRMLGAAYFVLMATIGAVLPLAIPTSWLDPIRVLDLSGLGVPIGATVGWVVYTFVGYVWHRSVHGSSLLWRTFHQLHHAPTRLDVASGAVFHPTEVAAYTLMTLATTTVLLGLDPLAAAWLGFWASFVSFFQHANLRSPQWLGYFVQRPEAHALHHHADGPRGNFADLPLWDVLFGTFHNPAAFPDEPVGFRNGADRRWVAMWAFRDVAAGSAPAPQPSRTARAA